MKMIRYIIKGAGNLPDYGPHPGNFWLAYFTILGAFAGGYTQGTVIGVLNGALFMLVPFGIPYCLGAIHRAKLSERNE